MQYKAKVLLHPPPTFPTYASVCYVHSMSRPPFSVSPPPPLPPLLRPLGGEGFYAISTTAVHLYPNLNKKAET